MGSWIQPIYCLIMLSTGFLKVTDFLPKMYLSKQNLNSVKYIDVQNEKMMMTIFNAIATFGDVFGLLIGNLIIYQTGLGWHWYIVIYSLITFTSGLAFYLVAEELPLERIPEHENLWEEIKQQFFHIVETLSKPNIFLIIIEIALCTCLFYNMLTWYPFFFTSIGLGEYSTYISMIPAICFSLAPFIIEPVLKLCERRSDQVLILLFVLNVGAFIWLMILSKHTSDHENVVQFFILIIVQGLVYFGPFARMGLNEVAIEGRENETVIFYIFISYDLIQCGMVALSYFLVGVFMEHGTLPSM